MQFAIALVKEGPTRYKCMEGSPAAMELRAPSAKLLTTPGISEMSRARGTGKGYSLPEGVKTVPLLMATADAEIGSAPFGWYSAQAKSYCRLQRCLLQQDKLEWSARRHLLSNS